MFNDDSVFSVHRPQLQSTIVELKEEEDDEDNCPPVPFLPHSFIAAGFDGTDRC
jgi:hypothetical protein